MALTADDLSALAAWRGAVLDAVGRTGDDVAALIGGASYRIARCESPVLPGVGRVAVRREPASADEPVRDLGVIRHLKLVTGVIARAPSPSLYKWADYNPPLTFGDFVFCDPRLAGDEEGVEADVGLFVATDRIHVCVYVTPLETGVRLAIPGPMGNGEYGGTTVFRVIFES